MVAGKSAVASGKSEEDKVQIDFARYGFRVFSSQAEYNKVKRNGSLPERYAVRGMPFKSEYRPNTQCKMDWGCFVSNRLVLHIECKMQEGGGSVSGKLVPAALELVDQIRLGNCDSVFLVIPPENTINRLSPCDIDYFNWAKRILKTAADSSVVADVAGYGSSSELGGWLSKKFRVPKRIIEV